MQVKQLARAALFLALTLIFQIVFRPFAQPLVGPLVNMMLILTVLFIGPFWAVCIGILTPLVAFLAGLLGVFVMMPVVMLGNALYVVIFALIVRKKAYIRQGMALVIGSLFKFAFLFTAVRQLVPLFLPNVPPALIATFSLPQLFTALIGGFLALVIYHILIHQLRIYDTYL